VPGTGAETETSYRARVLQAQLAASQGMLSYLKTLLGNVPNVQTRLVSAVADQSTGKWTIVCGGGDPYQVAYAIYQAVPDIANLVGSTLEVIGVTKANPGVVTTNINHLFSPGQAVKITGATPSGYSGNFVVLAVPTETSFSLGTAFPAINLSNLTWASTAGGRITGTTATPHGITPGSSFTVSGASPAGYNGNYTALAGTSGTTILAAQTTTLTSPAATFGQVLAGTANYDTSGLSDWVSGGVITPNLRNVLVTITDYPDTYQIPYVSPPPQNVTMTVVWNTSSPNFVSTTAVAQAAAPALADYVNSVPTGQPLNLLEMNAVFQASIESILAPYLLTRLVFSVSIDGVGTPPDAGTEIIVGDPLSYFTAAATGINVVQG